MGDETKFMWRAIIRRRAEETQDPELLAAIEDADATTDIVRESRATFLSRMCDGLSAWANEKVPFFVDNIGKFAVGLCTGIAGAITWAFTDGILKFVKSLF